MQFLIVFLLIVSSFGLDHNVEEPTESEKPTRNGRILNFFSVVRFPNNACSGGNSLNGTCYSSEECSSKGGSNSGSCAGGYGVCCTCKFKSYFINIFNVCYVLQFNWVVDKRPLKIAPISNRTVKKSVNAGSKCANAATTFVN